MTDAAAREAIQIDIAYSGYDHIWSKSDVRFPSCPTTQQIDDKVLSVQRGGEEKKNASKWMKTKGIWNKKKCVHRFRPSCCKRPARDHKAHVHIRVLVWCSSFFFIRLWGLCWTSRLTSCRGGSLQQLLKRVRGRVKERGGALFSKISCALYTQQSTPFSIL